jgi:hypothetical protein
MPVSIKMNEGSITRKVNNNILDPIITIPAISGQITILLPMLLLFLSFVSPESGLILLNVLHQRY